MIGGIGQWALTEGEGSTQLMGSWELVPYNVCVWLIQPYHLVFPIPLSLSLVKKTWCNSNPEDRKSLNIPSSLLTSSQSPTEASDLASSIHSLALSSLTKREKYLYVPGVNCFTFLYLQGCVAETLIPALLASFFVPFIP